MAGGVLSNAPYVDTPLFAVGRSAILSSLKKIRLRSPQHLDKVSKSYGVGNFCIFEMKRC